MQANRANPSVAATLYRAATELVATEPAAGFGSSVCTNSAESLFTTRLAGGMVAWGATITPGIAAGGFLTVQSLFLPVTPGVGAATGNFDLASIAQRCAAIVANGSAGGVCPGCANGALGAAKM